MSGGNITYLQSTSYNDYDAGAADTIQVAIVSPNKIGIYMQSWKLYWQIFFMKVGPGYSYLTEPEKTYVSKNSAFQLFIGSPLTPEL